MAIKKFVAWAMLQGSAIRYLLDRDSVEYGEIIELSTSKDPLLYSLCMNGSSPYLLIIGFRLTDWQPEERTRSCNVDTIESGADQYLLDQFARMSLGKQGIFPGRSTVFYE